MNIEQLKSEIIEIYNELDKNCEEAQNINKQIIERQKEHILILENHIQELRNIIENYILAQKNSYEILSIKW